MQIDYTRKLILNKYCKWKWRCDEWNRCCETSRAALSANFKVFEFSKLSLFPWMRATSFFFPKKSNLGQATSHNKSAPLPLLCRVLTARVNERWSKIHRLRCISFSRTVFSQAASRIWKSSFTKQCKYSGFALLLFLLTKKKKSPLDIDNSLGMSGIKILELEQNLCNLSPSKVTAWYTQCPPAGRISQS